MRMLHSPCNREIIFWLIHFWSYAISTNNIGDSLSVFTVHNWIHNWQIVSAKLTISRFIACMGSIWRYPENRTDNSWYKHWPSIELWANLQSKTLHTVDFTLAHRPNIKASSGQRLARRCLGCCSCCLNRKQLFPVFHKHVLPFKVQRQ